MRRRFFIGLTVILWVVTLLIALEVMVRMANQRRAPMVEAHIEQIFIAGREADAKFLTMHPGPAAPPPVPPAPSRESFAELDDSGRRELAEKRNELIVECDEKGCILAAYAPTSATKSEGLTALYRELSPEKSFFTLLSREQEEDARRALGSEIHHRGFFNREYLMADGSENKELLLDFFFTQHPGARSSSASFSVWIQDSIWEVQGKKFKPHVRKNSVFGYAHFTTNSRGFRDYEVQLPRPENTYRIVCIGGSTTFEGPRTDITYPKLLERKLRKYFGTTSIEVINCGIPALSSAGERQRIKDYLALEPNLIVHYNFVNDLGSRMYGAMHPFPGSLSPVRRIKWRLKDSEFVFRHAPCLYLPRDAVWLRDLRAYTMDNIRALGRIAHEHGVSVALCSFAYPDIGNADPLERAFFDKRIELSLGSTRLDAANYVRYAQVYATEVKQMCEEEGWLYVPVAENLTGGSVYFSDICHMFCAGMDRKAEIIFEGIRDFVAANAVL